MKVESVLPAILYDCLYIPHGSDERKSHPFGNCSITPFISHMVQMKAHQNLIMFAMRTSLYPTWFRWKFESVLPAILYDCLYIPHGSDESIKILPFRHSFCSFISHMVQMKEKILIVCSETKPTLYPTWFRWKMSINISVKYPTRFFISHMVQMKDTPRKDRDIWLKPLYIPHGSDESCWFCLFFSWCHLLYIPHGSDERMNSAICFFTAFFLYIPHGSDERKHPRNGQRSEIPSLYPTWFRWKLTTSNLQIANLITLYIPHGSDERYDKPKDKNTPRWPLYPTWFRWKVE